MRRTSHRSFVLIAGAVALVGCGKGDTPGSQGDAGSRRGEASAAGDGASVECDPGRHACDGRCVDDMPNEPASGCRLGCGEPCPTPADAVASCTADGHCTFECGDGHRREGDRCVCDPRTCDGVEASCGTLEDGCGGTIECGMCEDGYTCNDGTCGCPHDEAESNEARAQAYLLGAYKDRPRTERTHEFSIHAEDDIDWYQFTVEDDPLDATNPVITVTVDGIPEGSDYDLGLWFMCTSGGDRSSCEQGSEAESTDSIGCVSEQDGTASETVQMKTECSGTDEDGQALVRVSASHWADTCAPYSLEIAVD